MINSGDPDQLIWVCSVCKGRAYPGSEGLGLIVPHCFIGHTMITEQRNLSKNTRNIVITYSLYIGYPLLKARMYLVLKFRDNKES